MISPDSLKDITVLKENERQRIVLAENADRKKYLRREINDDKREIYKALQKINHPNIPKIYYVGLTDKTIVIEEYIEGESLTALMEQNRNISKKQLYYILEQILSAISELHGNKIIHRDIKPDNILINESNHTWLIDYDIARICREEVRKDTEYMGTFGYAPIEQYGMFPTDYKTDIYSFGVTLDSVLSAFSIKGFLHKIAHKCKRFDPLDRYGSAKAVKRAINFGRFKIPLIGIITLAVALLLAVCIRFKADSGDWRFKGFADGINEIKYSEYSTFFNSTIFSTTESWEHLMLLDDMNKKGKIKLGRNNTKINADITLNDGALNVSLDDKKGHKFSHTFKFNNQYMYNKYYTEDLRKNADIICRDFDYDDIPELLIGLNECLMGVEGRYFYNQFNYCIAWCVKYDEDNGFILCDGDMFSNGYPFNFAVNPDNLNIEAHETIDRVTWYGLEDNKIIPLFTF